MRITLFEYIANNRPAQAKEVIEGFGYKVNNVRTVQDMVVCIKQFVRQEQEEALKALAEIHPDRELILSTSTKNFSADGSDGFNETVKQLTPVQPAPTIQAKSDHTSLIIAGIIVSTLFLATAIIVNKK